MVVVFVVRCSSSQRSVTSLQKECSGPASFQPRFSLASASSLTEGVIHWQSSSVVRLFVMSSSSDFPIRISLHSNLSYSVHLLFSFDPLCGFQSYQVCVDQIFQSLAWLRLRHRVCWVAVTIDPFDFS